MEKNKSVYDEIKKETHFLYNNEEYRLYLEDYTREFGYLLTRFYIITDVEHFKKFHEEKYFFNGIFSKLKMPVKCYIAGTEHDFVRNEFKISIVAEEIKV